jgi:hypothetical protein
MKMVPRHRRKIDLGRDNMGFKKTLMRDILYNIDFELRVNSLGPFLANDGGGDNNGSKNVDNDNDNDVHDNFKMIFKKHKPCFKKPHSELSDQRK